MSQPPRLRSRLGAVLASAALLTGSAGVGALLAAPASAATVGYVRLAHLSPDTPPVDVYLSAVTPGATARKFPAVPYGVVSGYLPLDAGTYSVAMRKANDPESVPPVLSTQVTVAAGGAYTVAGVGRFADLGLRVIGDDLARPAAGKAKLRIVHASVRAPLLDISVAGGAPVATGVAFATTSAYQEVQPGRWTLRLQPSGGAATEVTVNSAAGGVYSVLVLDGKNGGLTVEVRTDAQGGSIVPQGGVDTGAGGTAGVGRRPGALLPVAVLLMAVGALTALLVARRRTRAVART